ncbi:LEAF RUST 10 DISEASE-RESISTANCE LOCUS RECEPTOR-LIKE PROTEIN KINASE-like 2.4 isoform X1 [Vitis riparia]|uniref:LEAF RUST 10 DISEASE-RESISTANCE LOCUS RECEPTOR-LIKE PROTEIN KINASE-like 2.4 isoform X1 n=1 Tax=Vitis riparia TaxID=96939 RepID=UPI00155A1ADD|nr:LEAF RUST 10 DISEASE-RESISTANCE LOCUS RECEPTOR-LIKE PROTEIN KINASE-like 2.4 isoform X1 [Vitis riparia]
MNSLFFSSSPSLGLFLLLVLVLFDFPLSLGNPAELYKYNTCSKEFNCGNITGVSYPFWGFDRPLGCGHLDLQLNCHDGIATIEIMGVNYRVLSFNKDAQTLRIARQDYLKGICSPLLVNTTLDPKLFDYAGVYEYVTFFYGCPPPAISVMPQKFSCSIAGIPLKDGYYIGGPQPQGPGACNVSVFVLVLVTSVLEEIRNLNSDQLIEGVIGKGFEVRLNVDSRACSECLESKGVCGYDLDLNQTTCYCKDQIQAFKTCTSPTDDVGTPQESSPPDHKPDVGILILIAALLFGVCSIMVVAVFIWSLRRKSSSNTWRVFWKKTRNSQNVEAFLEKYASLAPKRYSYSDVKKMTDSFRNKLGQGGYGIVYKGNLPDGHLVAVKVLSEPKGNGEEFINEVASISRTSHVNIVTLLGFCFEGHKRALIYEFMPNGSLEKYTYDENKPRKMPPLGWEKIYQIAIGIAHGLEYLHSGCNTRILHLDIKPQSILLDQDFTPKICDFGLAKLCPTKESSMSLLSARGTVGYVAPEVFSRNFGVVSHKSDVYSFGMMILEMVAGRKIIDTGASCSSEIYFPHWIYKHLELEDDHLKLQHNFSEGGEPVARKMIFVGLWCIQTNPANRPSIHKVVDMLKGSHEDLQIPPKPFPSSPVRTPPGTPTTSSTNLFQSSDECTSTITLA